MGRHQQAPSRTRYIGLIQRRRSRVGLIQRRRRRVGPVGPIQRRRRHEHRRRRIRWRWRRRRRRRRRRWLWRRRRWRWRWRRWRRRWGDGFHIVVELFNPAFRIHRHRDVGPAIEIDANIGAHGVLASQLIRFAVHEKAHRAHLMIAAASKA